MKCYFCQSQLEKDDSQPHWTIYKSCDFCTTKYNLNSVITVCDENNKLMYAHIYPDGIQTLAFPGVLGRPYNVIVGHNYHIRLHLQENYTNIGDPTDSNPNDILQLPGFPINPSNVREKLKLYLLFL